MIVLGFIAGKVLKVDGRSVAALMFYIIVPLVMADAVSRTTVTMGLLLLPLVVFSISTFMCLAFYAIGRRIWQDSMSNILGMAVGVANVGYFGLPLAILLLDEQGVGLYLTAIMGTNLFESSVGFYITAKGKHTSRDALLKVLKLPLLYAFFVGLAVSLLGWEFPVFVQETVGHMRGTYVVLGMMIIGLGLANITSWKIGFRFMSLAMLAKFVLWPLIIGGVVWLDISWLHLFNDSMHKVLLLLSIMPLAANTVAIATLLDTHPDKVATTVLASTLFAMFYVPLMIMWLF